MNKTTFNSTIISRIIIFSCIIIHFMFFSDFKLFTRTFTHWDASYYLGIAQYWYPPSPHPNWAFLPLFPCFLRIIFLITHSLFLTEIFGLLINSCTFILSSYVLYQLTKSLNKDIKNNALIAIFFPTTVFCSLIYTESLFLLFTLLTFLFFLHEKYEKSLLSSFLASLTRANGILLSPLYLYAKKPIKTRTLMAFIPFLPFLLFNLYGYYLTGLFPITEISRMTFWPDNHPTTMHDKIHHTLYSLYIIFAKIFLFAFVEPPNNLYIILVHLYLFIFTTLTFVSPLRSIRKIHLKNVLTSSFKTSEEAVLTYNISLLYFSSILYLVYGNPYSLIRYLLPSTLIVMAAQKPLKRKLFTLLLTIEIIFLGLLTIIYLDGQIFIG